MASVNWLKLTTQKAGALNRHFGERERVEGRHSNKHIDTEMSFLNYVIGARDYSNAYNHMRERTRSVDEMMPPKRIRKDRVTCCMLEVPCPRQITEQGKADDFFRQVHRAYCDFFGADNVHGTFVHKDEIHDYKDKDGTVKTSCEHAHTLVSAFTADKGINGKAFVTKSNMRDLNAIVDDMCFERYGVHLNTGENPQRKTVEDLKLESLFRDEVQKKLDVIRATLEDHHRTFKEEYEEARENIEACPALTPREYRMQRYMEGYNSDTQDPDKTMYDDFLEYERDVKETYISRLKEAKEKTERDLKRHDELEVVEDWADDIFGRWDDDLSL